MFRHAFANLWATLRLTMILLLQRLRGGRYPLINYVHHGLVFNAKQDIAELIGFNAIKYHPVMKLLTHYTQPLVIVLSMHGDHFRLNLYRLIDDDGQGDIVSPTSSLPGRDGCFHYITHGGRLYHAKRPTSVTRQMGYFPNEPVLSFRLVMSDIQRQELYHLIETDVPHLNGYRVSVTREADHSHVTHSLGQTSVKSYTLPTSSEKELPCP